MSKLFKTYYLNWENSTPVVHILYILYYWVESYTLTETTAESLVALEMCIASLLKYYGTPKTQWRKINNIRSNEKKIRIWMAYDKILHWIQFSEIYYPTKSARYKRRREETNILNTLQASSEQQQMKLFVPKWLPTFRNA